MARPRNMENLFDAPKSNTTFSEGSKSKGILDDYAVRQVLSTKEFGGSPVFVGPGLPFGEIFTNDNTTVTSVSSAGFTQFLHFDMNGHSNNSTPDHTEDHITITKKGTYMVDCCVNIKNSSGAAHVVEVVIAKNNLDTIFPNMRRHRTLGTGTDVGAIPLCGHLSLNVGDTIEVWINSNSASARDVIGEDVVLMISQIGGT